MENYWLSWDEVNQRSYNKKLIFFGRSEDWIPKTIKKLNQTPAYIVDNNIAVQGKTYMNIEVKNPDCLKDEKTSDIFIVITTGSYHEIVDSLKSNGFISGENFCNCPEYRDWYVLEEMRSYKSELFIASSDYEKFKHAKRSSKKGGGIYKYTLGENIVQKVAKGSFRQMIQIGDNVYALEFVKRKLIKFDLNFNQIEQIPLDSAQYCGLTFNKKRNYIIMANSSSDIITIMDGKDYKIINQINFSNKHSKTKGSSFHHINDLACTDDYLYVSYFSQSGNWRNGIFDGGISEYHLDEMHEKPVQVVDNLWKPHSVSFIQGDLSFVDSMTGNYYINSKNIAATFQGFIRGIEYDNKFIYIGQSETMYVSELFGIKDNIMLNAGFYIFNKDKRASRFYPLLDIMNIHDLLIIK